MLLHIAILILRCDAHSCHQRAPSIYQRNHSGGGDSVTPDCSELKQNWSIFPLSLRKYCGNFYSTSADESVWRLLSYILVLTTPCLVFRERKWEWEVEIEGRGRRPLVFFLGLILSSLARSACSIFPPPHVSGPRHLTLRPLVSSLLSPSITLSTGASGRLCHVEAKWSQRWSNNGKPLSPAPPTMMYDSVSTPHRRDPSPLHRRDTVYVFCFFFCFVFSISLCLKHSVGFRKKIEAVGRGV